MTKNLTRRGPDVEAFKTKVVRDVQGIFESRGELTAPILFLLARDGSLHAKPYAMPPDDEGKERLLRYMRAAVKNLDAVASIFAAEAWSSESARQAPSKDPNRKEIIFFAFEAAPELKLRCESLQADIIRDAAGKGLLEFGEWEDAGNIGRFSNIMGKE
jgi:hypothetical protein